MGKAARRRKARRRDYLVKLSYQDPKRFESEWEARLDSWLSEVRTLARSWAAGEIGSETRAFEIVDAAMEILQKCERSIYEKYAPETYSLLCHECCSQISRVIDPRLYRLSALAGL